MICRKREPSKHCNFARLALLLLLIPSCSPAQSLLDDYGANFRSDTSKKVIYLCFTGHDFDDGFEHVSNVLDSHNVKASFFLTGDFIRSHKELTSRLFRNGHFVGAHSDKHLLYNDWTQRDSLLVSKEAIKKDIKQNLDELKSLGIRPSSFMPPYEWYNTEVVNIAKELGQESINFSPGTRSNADYTSPEMKNYVSTEVILKSIFNEEAKNGMNGFHLLIHPGTSDKRLDKLYLELANIISYFHDKGYNFQRFENK